MFGFIVMQGSFNFGLFSNMLNFDGMANRAIAPPAGKIGPNIGGDSVAPDGAPPETRRGSPRRRVLRNALIVYRGGNCTLRCMMLNLSATGALLQPADPMLCPNSFALKLQDGPLRHCEVVWRKGGMVGVRFL